MSWNSLLWRNDEAIKAGGNRGSPKIEFFTAHARNTHHDSKMNTDIFPRPFALGTTSPILRRQAKVCKKSSTPIPKPIQPLLSHAAKITNDELTTLLWCGPTLTDRYSKIKLLNESIDSWNPSILPSNYVAECKIKCDILFKEQQVRSVFRNLARIWLYKRYRNRLLNTEDPATMEVPRTPIHVYSTSQKGSYVFEASTLIKSIEKDLCFAQYLFPEPSHPKNPLTNLFWKSTQRLHIIQQLRSLNIGSWILEGYVQCNYKLRMFRDIFMVPLKVRALMDLTMNAASDDTVEFVCEFIEDMNEYYDNDDSNLGIIKWAVRHMYSHPYIREWRKLWARIYQYSILYTYDYLDSRPVLQNKLYRPGEKLLFDFKSISELAAERMLRESSAAPAPDVPDESDVSDASESDEDDEDEEELTQEERVELQAREFQAARRIQALARGWLVRRYELPPGLIQPDEEVIVWPSAPAPAPAPAPALALALSPATRLPNIVVRLHNIQTLESFTQRIVHLLEGVIDVPDTEE